MNTVTLHITDPLTGQQVVEELTPQQVAEKLTPEQQMQFWEFIKEKLLWQNAPGLQLINALGREIIPIILSYLNVEGEDRPFFEIFQSLKVATIQGPIPMPDEVERLQRENYPIRGDLDTYFPKEISRLVLSHLTPPELDDFKTLTPEDRRAIERAQFPHIQKINATDLLWWMNKLGPNYVSPPDHRFSLDMDYISLQDIQRIGTMFKENVREVTTRDSFLGDIEYGEANFWEHLPRLTPDDYSLSQEQIRLIPTLFPRLEALNLRSFNVLPNDMEALARGLPLLKSFTFCPNMGEAGLVSLTRHSKQLETLHMIYPRPQVIRYLSQFPSLTKLTLEWENDSPHDGDASRFAGVIESLSSCQALTSLSLSTFESTDFKLLNRIPSLKELEIFDSSFVGRIEDIEWDGNPSRITSLLLALNDADDERLEDAKALTSFPDLRTLILKDCHEESFLPSLDGIQLDTLRCLHYIPLYAFFKDNPSVISREAVELKAVREFRERNPQVKNIEFQCGSGEELTLS